MFFLLLFFWRSSNGGLASFIHKFFLLMCIHICFRFYIYKLKECSTQDSADHKVKSKHFKAYLNTNASLPEHNRQKHTCFHTHVNPKSPCDTNAVYTQHYKFEYVCMQRINYVADTYVSVVNSKSKIRYSLREPDGYQIVFTCTSYT